MQRFSHTGTGGTEPTGTIRLKRHRKERRNTMKKDTYAGRINNNGTQKAEALFTTKKKAKPVVKKGNDLRNGTKGDK